jgi:predicted nuclease of predicted toxin-antitoxin system
MNFKLDENLPADLLADLHAAGHQAQTVHEERLTGAPDPAVMEKVQSEHRIFLTMDKGIANTRMYPPERYAGIILFRPRSTGRGTVLTFVRRHLQSLLQTDLTGHLLVVSERGTRIR